jgi:hypothetical protein
MNSSILGILAGVLVSSSLACARDELAPSGRPLASNQVLATDATVRYVDLEGGCWALEAALGKYEPVGLPPEFRKDGLAVHVVMRGAPDMMSICQMAPIVRLDSIRVR